MIRIERAYDEPEPGDGRRVLVDRIWPRGVPREELTKKPETWQPLLEAARGDGTLTLVYGASDRERNNAVALRDFLRRELAEGDA